MKPFKVLHQQKKAFHLGNVWDVQSALLFQKLGFKAVGTSSAAIAASLGYDDGEDMPFEDLVWMVKKIHAKVNIPLSVDIEGGYSRNVDDIIENIKTLHQIGVAGINIEDSAVYEKREILDAGIFSDTILKVKSYLLKNGMNIFLNVRTDSYILGLDHPLEKTLERIKRYEESGADGVFVPCIVDEKEIAKVVQSTSLPINVLCMPNLPSFSTLTKLGVRRISSGHFIHHFIAGNLEQTINEIVEEQSFNSLF